MKYVIIDGYNLIFQCGFEGRQANDRALERARERLYRELKNVLSDDLRAETTIVFDSASRPAGVASDRYRKNGMNILFAVGFEDADSLIMELVRKHPVPGSLTVVSSDHRIQRAVRARRALAVDSDTWFDSLTELALRDEEEETPPDNKPLLSSHETEALQREFEITLDKDHAYDNEDKDRGDREFDEQTSEKQADFEDGFDPFPEGWFEDLDTNS